MLSKRIIPCLDVRNGRVVKGIRFVNIRDAGDPVEMASAYDREGADELIFLDITASHERRHTVVDLARRCAEELFIPFTIGGGMRDESDIRKLPKAWADEIAINSAALANPDVINRCSKRFGAQCIVVAIDAKLVSANDEKQGTFCPRGAPVPGATLLIGPGKSLNAGGEIMLTSMDTDGTQDGYDIDHPGDYRSGERSGNRIRRGRHTRSPGRGGKAGGRGRGSGGQYLSLRHLFHPAGQGVHGGGGDTDAADLKS